MLYRFLRFPGGRDKAVTLSYDDGVRQDIRFAQVIDQYGLKCTFNLNTGLMTEDRKDRKILQQEVQKYLLDKGHEVAVHGKYHKAPGLCRLTELACDVLDCRRELEEMFGIIIRGMAYPDSGIRNIQNISDYSAIRQILQELDIAYARTLGGDNDEFKLPADWYAWMPTTHHAKEHAIPYAQKFVELNVDKQYEASRFPRLFYMWGHTYEFDNDNNWDQLEKLCRILGNREEIWYATNMEIYNYVNAYRRLELSADGNIVYNPTLVKIWFDYNKTLYTIEPGQTIKIG